MTVEETETELDLLRDVYNCARRVLRYRGVDVERAEKAYQQMYDTVHNATDFYLDPDSETEM